MTRESPRHKPRDRDRRPRDDRKNDNRRPRDDRTNGDRRPRDDRTNGDRRPRDDRTNDDRRWEDERTSDDRRPRDRTDHERRPRARTNDDGRPRNNNSNKRPRAEAVSSPPTSQALSADALAKLNFQNEKELRKDTLRAKKPKTRPRIIIEEKPLVAVRSRNGHRRKRRRVVSGALLEEGEGRKLEAIKDESSSDEVQPLNRRKKGIWICAGIVLLLLIIIIAIAVVVSNKNKDSNSSGSSHPDGSSSGVPTGAKGTYLDPGSWLDTTDFNTTYTNETVGGLPIIGLYTNWDDSASANANTPPLNKPWGSYAKTPARGVNLGGWLSLEPFITPSLFNYDSKLGIIDEWTLCTHLGPSASASTLEKHYSTFVTEQTFIDIANAGLDHVRIPFSYWAVATYDGDPYVFRTSWRYLLRAIEWSRKHGLRVNLDLHALPGSQNGWNHSGRQGVIGWLNGTDGALNGQRSLDIHNQLSTFFAQDRYKNIIAFYGLANEPKMMSLPISAVNGWSASAYQIIRENGVEANIVFGDGFLGLPKWKGQLQNYQGLVLDVHQYVIFNNGQIIYNHTTKVNYACTGWTEQAEQSTSVSTGFGPTLFAEWSQADTDCVQYLNNVGIGNRWTGTYNTGNPETQALSSVCPTHSTGPPCDCTNANADPSTYSSAYKQFLKMFAEAQMTSFEKGWGWFYWTWKTESAPQWSYEAGLAAGILPAKAYSRDFDCSQTVPSFSDLPENY